MLLYAGGVTCRHLQAPHYTYLPFGVQLAARTRTAQLRTVLSRVWATLGFDSSGRALRAGSAELLEGVHSHEVFAHEPLGAAGPNGWR